MRCSACPGINKCIPPDGPRYTNQPLFVGEAPNLQENHKGQIFISSIGQELNRHYLPLAGLSREGSTITNVIKCLPDRPKGKIELKKAKDVELLLSCAEANLYREIEELRPSVIVPMGAIACYALDSNISLDMHHGIPLSTSFGTVFPMWHPSGGIHEPKKMLQIRTDWVRFRSYLRGTLHIAEDPYPSPDYVEADRADVEDIDCTLPMGADTEHSRSLGPYFYTWSQQPGSARLIRAERSDLLAALQRKLDKFEANIYFHNWLYDWTITEDMGITFPMDKMRDTMVMAFNLGNLPQGLKVLAYRLLGMTMQDFEDLVKPYSTVEVMQYYKKAAGLEWEKPPEELKMDDKTGKWKVYKPQSMSTKLKRFFTDCRKNDEKDVFAMWDKNWVNQRAELESKVGPYPGLDILHVPFEKAAFYAMRDADADIRLVPILNRMKELAQSGKLQEQWL